ncbi:MAG: hypothetical protein KJ626_01670, partial [Verrucomicrobia bacterium]|nr:hypothetical protein [Verrucomicrobiota bacterium]
LVAGVVSTASAQQGPQMDMSELQNALGQLGQMMSGGTNKVSLVNFREIKALLPKQLPGAKRTSASGERTGAFGMNVSFAEASYETADGGVVEIKITDMGGMEGMMSMAKAGWAMADIDRETDTGFERTSTYKGHKCLEKFDSSYNEGEINVMADRFSIEIAGVRVPFDLLKQTIELISFDELLALQPEEQ